mmetsp:Transcript_11131/g.22247  ORF Transcript_11131/g.22247 Transcript_11131/m.22247 type:complete len:305 (-) Transcript_11131:932-1846(-)
MMASFFLSNDPAVKCANGHQSGLFSLSLYTLVGGTSFKPFAFLSWLTASVTMMRQSLTRGSALNTVCGFCHWNVCCVAFSASFWADSSRCFCAFFFKSSMLTIFDAASSLLADCNSCVRTPPSAPSNLPLGCVAGTSSSELDSSDEDDDELDSSEEELESSDEELDSSSEDELGFGAGGAAFCGGGSCFGEVTTGGSSLSITISLLFSSEELEDSEEELDVSEEEELGAAATLVTFFVCSTTGAGGAFAGSSTVCFLFFGDSTALFFFFFFGDSTATFCFAAIGCSAFVSFAATACTTSFADFC